MDLQVWSGLLEEWAARVPFITRVWITGGFIQRDYGPHHDVDVAVDVAAHRFYRNPHNTFSAFRDRWCVHLGGLLAYPVHVLHYDEDIDTDTPIAEGNVVRIVAQGSLAVYPREAAGPESDS